MSKTLENTRQLIGWVTGSHYEYSDGEIWPELKYHTPRMLVWRLALRLGVINRIVRRSRGDVWPRLATTMIGGYRSRNIVDLAGRVFKQYIKGDFVDCGVWRGGSTILMKSAIDEAGEQTRKVWCCDTFSGFDKADATAEGVNCPKALSVSMSEVKYNFKKHGVSTGNVEFLEGKVQNTLAKITGPVALLRVDVDMAAPTLHVLETIYPLMPSGGVVIVDDYGCTSFACKSAVDDFLTRNPAFLNFIDGSGVWWVKP